MSTPKTCRTTRGCVATGRIPGRHIDHGRMEAIGGVQEGVSATGAARTPGASRSTPSRVPDGRQGISASLALELEAGDWGKADVWMARQSRISLAQERNGIGQSRAESDLETGSAREAQDPLDANQEPPATRLRTTGMVAIPARI